MSNESSVILESRGIHKTFRKGRVDVPVLKGVDLQVRKGETLAIVGSSGAGKSTLMHILGTLETPTSGQVLFDGKDVFGLADDARCFFRNRNIGFVFQFHYLLPEFSALENVMMPGLIAGRDESTLRGEAKQLLEEVGLGHRLTHKPGELSGGESQRVAVARALVMNPGILFGDELTGNLDSENSSNLISLLLEMNKTRGAALVVVTHDTRIASRMSRVIEIRDGRVV